MKRYVLWLILVGDTDIVLHEGTRDGGEEGETTMQSQRGARTVENTIRGGGARFVGGERGCEERFEVILRSRELVGK